MGRVGGVDDTTQYNPTALFPVYQVNRASIVYIDLQSVLFMVACLLVSYVKRVDALLSLARGKGVSRLIKFLLAMSLVTPRRRRGYEI
jgi:hypothetical protein